MSVFICQNNQYHLIAGNKVFYNSEWIELSGEDKIQINGVWYPLSEEITSSSSSSNDATPSSSSSSSSGIPIPSSSSSSGIPIPSSSSSSGIPIPSSSSSSGIPIPSSSSSSGIPIPSSSSSSGTPIPSSSSSSGTPINPPDPPIPSSSSSSSDSSSVPMCQYYEKGGFDMVCRRADYYCNKCKTYFCSDHVYWDSCDDGGDHDLVEIQQSS